MDDNNSVSGSVLKPAWNNYGKWFVALLIMLLILGGIEYMGFRDMVAHWFLMQVQPWLENNPVLAPMVFILVYIISVILMVPGTIMSIAGGVIFGPIWGTIYVSFAALIGAGIAFLIARYIAADWVEENIGETLEAIKKGIERDGLEFVAFTRLVPIFPFNLLNYAFGLTRINFWVHLWASGIAMLPGTFAYVYAGYSGKELFTGELGMVESIVIGTTALGLLILIWIIPRWIKRTREMDLVQEDGD